VCDLVATILELVMTMTCTDTILISHGCRAQVSRIYGPIHLFYLFSALVLKYTL
jgi:hypothetical protein